MKTILVVLTLLTSVSALAADTYDCQVRGQYTNRDNETAKVNVEGLRVEADANRSTLFGREAEPRGLNDFRPSVMPWSISIRSERDGGETPLVLTLGAPNQNGSVGKAYGELGTKYLGFIRGSQLEALCRKL